MSNLGKKQKLTQTNKVNVRLKSTRKTEQKTTDKENFKNTN